MIIQNTRKIIFPITRYYFGFNKFKINQIKPLGIIEILQSKEKLNLEGFHEKEFTTGIIDLTKDVNEIFKNFGKNTRYEIKRAEKEGIKYINIDKITYSTIKEYISFYNKFAKIKGLSTIDYSYFYGLENNIYITKAVLKNIDLVYHLYLFDKNIGKVRLLQSCSLFRSNEIGINKNLFGYANRGLHYFDMIKFKELGFKEYDFGGLYLGKTDISKLNIDKFKLGFNPKIETHYSYIKLGIILKMLFKLLGKKF